MLISLLIDKFNFISGTITLRQVKYFAIILCWSRFVKEANCGFACLTDSYCVPTLWLDISASIQ